MKGMIIKDFLKNPIIEGSKNHIRGLIKLPEIKNIGIGGIAKWHIDFIEEKGNGGIQFVRFRYLNSVSNISDFSGRKREWITHDAKPVYGKGETVYIKENHVRYDYPSGDVAIKHYDNHNKAYCKDNETGETMELLQSDAKCIKDSLKEGYRKMSKVNLPKFAARHFIRVTKVSIERLQDISKKDCIKEGCYIAEWLWNGFAREYKVNYRSLHSEEIIYPTIKSAFVGLINHIEGEGAWDSNPYVFVYEFEYMRKSEPKLDKELINE